MDDAGATFALAASHVSTHSASYAGWVCAHGAPAVSAQNLLFLAGSIVDVAVGEGARTSTPPRSTLEVAPAL